MMRFVNDYQEIAHENVMQALMQAKGQFPGYAEDEICGRVREQIKDLCKAPDAKVHFLVGGTQVNLTLLAIALKPYQGVLCADSGHIATHETGSVEACGHKVIGLPSENGKITGRQILDYCRTHFADSAHEHIVMPGAVYVSQSTEVGTIYTCEELNEIRAACDEYGLVLYLDGARLGYGLAAAEDGMDLPFLARVCDAFTIGGTKQGILFGEALVISNPALQRDFRYMQKQKGGMLAKGWLLGVQFEAILKDDLYMRLSRSAVAFAREINELLHKLGVSFLAESPTNQIFPILTNEQAEKLGKEIVYSDNGRIDENHVCIRLCTSWATTREQVDALKIALEKALG